MFNDIFWRLEKANLLFEFRVRDCFLQAAEMVLLTSELLSDLVMTAEVVENFIRFA